MNYCEICERESSEDVCEDCIWELSMGFVEHENY
ncbi:hypothetical protein ACUXCC_003457 [Cytobacillus horneckiae]